MLKLLFLLTATLAAVSSARTIGDSKILRSSASVGVEEHPVSYSLSQVVHQPYAASTTYSFANAGGNSTSSDSSKFTCDPSVRQITGYLELSRGGKKTKRYVGICELGVWSGERVTPTPSLSSDNHVPPFHPR